MSSGSRAVNRGHRAKLYPTQDQSATLRRWSGSARFLWNLSRDQRRGFRWTRDLPGRVKSATVSCAAGVWHPTCQSIARLHVRAANRRRDFAHKTSTHLAKNDGLVAIEALAVQSMTRSARGTVEEPGRHVRQKAGLNRAILDKAGA